MSTIVDLICKAFVCIEDEGTRTEAASLYKQLRGDLKKEASVKLLTILKKEAPQFINADELNHPLYPYHLVYKDSEEQQKENLAEIKKDMMLDGHFAFGREITFEDVTKHFTAEGDTHRHPTAPDYHERQGTQQTPHGHAVGARHMISRLLVEAHSFHSVGAWTAKFADKYNIPHIKTIDSYRGLLKEAGKNSAFAAALKKEYNRVFPAGSLARSEADKGTGKAGENFKGSAGPEGVDAHQNASVLAPSSSADRLYSGLSGEIQKALDGLGTGAVEDPIDSAFIDGYVHLSGNAKDVVGKLKDKRRDVTKELKKAKAAIRKLKEGDSSETVASALRDVRDAMASMARMDAYHSALVSLMQNGEIEGFSKTDAKWLNEHYATNTRDLALFNSMLVTLQNPQLATAASSHAPVTPGHLYNAQVVSGGESYNVVPLSDHKKVMQHFGRSKSNIRGYANSMKTKLISPTTTTKPAEAKPEAAPSRDLAAQEARLSNESKAEYRTWVKAHPRATDAEKNARIEALIAKWNLEQAPNLSDEEKGMWVNSTMSWLKKLADNGTLSQAEYNMLVHSLTGKTPAARAQLIVSFIKENNLKVDLKITKPLQELANEQKVTKRLPEISKGYGRLEYP